MTLLFSEGFDNCSSFKDVSGVFNVGASMLDDPRTIMPVLASGSVDSISPRNIGGSMIVLKSSYNLPSTSDLATIDNNQSINISGVGNSVSKFTFRNNFSFTNFPIFKIHKNGIFNFDIGDITFVDSNGDTQVQSVINITRTRNGSSVGDIPIYRNGDIYYAGNKFIGNVPVKSGDFVSIKEKNLNVGRINPNDTNSLALTAWAVETTGVFFPSVSIDLTKNLTNGVIGFGYVPLLPQSGSFGDGQENFTPIACLTDSQYRPHFFICNTNSGKIQLRKFSATNFANNNSINEYYDYSVFGSAKTDGLSQTYPRFLKSTTDPTLSIGGSGTNLTLIAESDVNKNTLVNNFWNYIELKFNMQTQDLALRINRKNTSTRNDLEFNGNNILNSTSPLTVLSGVFSGSGTYLTPYTGAISNSGIFKVNSDGNIFLNFQASWVNTTANSRTAAFFKNGIQEVIDLPQQGLNNTQFISSVNYKKYIPVISGDILGFNYSVISPTITAYFVPISSLSDQFDKTVRYLVLGTMWGQNINGVSPASNLGWKTLLDDIYVIESGSTLPNDFIGSVSCGRIPYDQLVNNTAASGSLISVSDTLSGSGGFTNPSGNGTLFFDAINQEFNVRSSGFYVNNNNIIGLSVGINGFSLNTEDYIGIGLDLPNNSGSYNYSPIVLSRNSRDGGYVRGPMYTTDPSGNKWTEEAVRSATFKLKTFSE